MPGGYAGRAEAPCTPCIREEVSAASLDFTKRVLQSETVCSETRSLRAISLPVMGGWLRWPAAARMIWARLATTSDTPSGRLDHRVSARRSSGLSVIGGTGRPVRIGGHHA